MKFKLTETSLTELEKVKRKLVQQIRTEFKKYTDWHYFDSAEGEYNWHFWNRDDFDASIDFLKKLGLNVYPEVEENFDAYTQWNENEAWGNISIWNIFNVIHKLYPNIQYKRSNNHASWIWAADNARPMWYTDEDLPDQVKEYIEENIVLINDDVSKFIIKLKEDFPKDVSVENARIIAAVEYLLKQAELVK